MVHEEKKKDVLELDDPLESKTMPKATLPPEVPPEEFYRERMPTVTDDYALEEARLASLVNSSIPPKRPSQDRHDAVPLDETSKLRIQLAPMDRVPRLTKSLSVLSDEPKTAYILSFIDGVLPLDTIIDVVGIPEIEVLRVVDRLFREGSLVFSTKP